MSGPDRPGMRTAGAARSARTVRTAVVWDLLAAALESAGSPGSPGSVAGAAGDAGGRVLDVLDVGGGTGGFAVPVAELGHRVVVVDPSPDALAALERRADEAGVRDRVRAVQGDVADLAGDLADAVPAGNADVVLCHGVLEHVDDPAAAIAACRAALRDGGLLSLLVAQRAAAVLARALTGHFDQARRALADPAGRWGDADPLPRRFAEAELVALVRAAGFEVRQVDGIRVVSDLVPAALVDGDPAAAAELLALERDVTADPVLRPLATQLHLLARWKG